MPLNSTVVGVEHAYTPLDGGQSAFAQGGSTFFVAYNSPSTGGASAQTRRPASCGVVAVHVQTGQANALQLLFGDQGTDMELGAMTLLPAPDGSGVYLYLAMKTLTQNGLAGGGETTRNALHMIKWSSARMAQATTASEELFFMTAAGGGKRGRVGGAAAVRGLSTLWASTALAPMFFARVEPAPEESYDAATGARILYPNGAPQTLFVADNIQRTFTPVQDPLSLHP